MWACVAGITIGTVSTLSPTTIWFTIAIAAMFVWARRDLGSQERRWVMAMLGVAVVLRVAMVAGHFLQADHTGQFFRSFAYDGDGRWVKLRSTVLSNVWAGIPVETEYFEFAFDHSFGWSSYILVLGYLQFLVGSAPYGVYLFNIALSVAGSVVLYRAMRSTYGPAVGIGGLAILLFMPSLFFWSVSAMKESFQFFLTAVGLVATAKTWHARTWTRKCGALIIAVLAIAALGTVRREIALAIGVGGTGVGLLAFLITRRAWLFAAAIVLLPAVCAVALRQPAVQDRVLNVLRPAAVAHLGNVHTEGHHYKLLDERFYALEPIDSMTLPEASRYVARALVSFAVTPAPWQVTSSWELAFLPEQMLWYALIVFAAFGVVPGLRRDATTTCLLCGYIAVGAATISIASGNIGTFVRHRDIVTPFMIWLSVLGIENVLAKMVASARAARAGASGSKTVWT